MEHDIPFGNSNRENGPTFLDFPLFLGIFQWDEPTKHVPFTAEPEIPEILTKWKAPSIMHHCNVTVVFIKFLKTTISYACKLKLASYDVGFQNFRKRGSVTAKSILPIQMTKSRVSGGDLRVCSVKYSHLFQKRL